MNLKERTYSKFACAAVKLTMIFRNRISLKRQGYIVIANFGTLNSEQLIATFRGQLNESLGWVTAILYILKAKLDKIFYMIIVNIKSAQIWEHVRYSSKFSAL
ncbi:hypothetical protein PPYR_09915 [Photinus pyralis]|uniref:Uncharacterized protein n=1 Tax=Photinus pyralis TaxID=7054 RepID=A0A5N4AEW8_PHOPY|nr:hypothetical protein PPYR_09915 [Photinus pyralis]